MQTALLGPDEVITTMVLVIPGFIALAIMLQLVGISKKVEFSEYGIWSVFVSGVIDLILVGLLGLPLPPTSDDFLRALATWKGGLVFSILVVTVGVSGAFFLRLDPVRRMRGVIWLRAKARKIPSLVWDDSFGAHFQQWLLAELTDGTRILGLLVRHSTGSEPREIYLANPELVTFDDTGNPSSTKIGEAILLGGENLKSIRFLTAPNDFIMRTAENS